MTTDSMVERLADALTERFKRRVAASAGKPFAETGVTVPAREIWLDYALAALEAMKEPTEAMKRAPQYKGMAYLSQWDTEISYRYMIDAALKEGE